MIRRVTNPPSRPTLVYDGECRFCRCQVERWKRRTGDLVDYVSSNSPEGRSRFSEIPTKAFDRSLQFILPDGRVYSGAHGAIKSWSVAGQQRWLLRLYERSSWCAALLEVGYRTVAGHRGLLSRFSPCARRMGDS